MRSKITNFRAGDHKENDSFVTKIKAQHLGLTVLLITIITLMHHWLFLPDRLCILEQTWRQGNWLWKKKKMQKNKQIKNQFTKQQVKFNSWGQHIFCLTFIVLYYFWSCCFEELLSWAVVCLLPVWLASSCVANQHTWTYSEYTVLVFALYSVVVREHTFCLVKLPALHMLTVKWLLLHPDNCFIIPVQFSDALQSDHYHLNIKKVSRDGKSGSNKLKWQILLNIPCLIIALKTEELGVDSDEDKCYTKKVK